MDTIDGESLKKRGKIAGKIWRSARVMGVITFHASILLNTPPGESKSIVILVPTKGVDHPWL